MKKSAVRAAFLDTVPVMTGYVFLGFGFGIVMHQSGYGGLWPVAMSLFIYAGSMQYVAVGLLTRGGQSADHHPDYPAGERPAPVLRHLHGGRLQGRRK